MPSNKVIVLVIIVIVIKFVSQSLSWRRRSGLRRSCSQVDCQVSPWSPWSPCSTSQCGISGNQQRTRHVTTNPSCNGRACPPNMQVSRICYGTTAVDCEYSAWSTWSACSSLQCGDTQTSRKYITARDQCGGTPCNITGLRKTQPCKQTFCVNQGTLINGDCLCKQGYYGSCCQYSSKYVDLLRVSFAGVYQMDREMLSRSHHTHY